MNAKFEFTVEGIDKKVAEAMLKYFLNFAELAGLKMAGGVTWEEDNEEAPETVS